MQILRTIVLCSLGLMGCSGGSQIGAEICFEIRDLSGETLDGSIDIFNDERLVRNLDCPGDCIYQADLELGLYRFEATVGSVTQSREIDVDESFEVSPPDPLGDKPGESCLSSNVIRFEFDTTEL